MDKETDMRDWDLEKQTVQRDFGVIEKDNGFVHVGQADFIETWGG